MKLSSYLLFFLLGIGSILQGQTVDCPAHQIVEKEQEEQIAKEKQNYQAEMFVEASITVLPETNVAISAGEYVLLTQDFWSQAGGDFKAIIRDCEEPSNSRMKTNQNSTTATYFKSSEQVRNYPNPFTTSTTIEFVLPQATNISLGIYDINGQLVQQLMTNEAKEKGIYQIKVDATTLVAGNYFYRLQTSNEVLSGQMILIE